MRFIGNSSSPLEDRIELRDRVRSLVVERVRSYVLLIVAKVKRIRFVFFFHKTQFHRRFHGQLLFSSTTTHSKKDSMNDTILADNYLLEFQRQWQEQVEGALLMYALSFLMFKLNGKRKYQ
jgi:hypothetical protein